MAQPSPFEISRHMMSLWIPQAIHGAAELGIADALAGGPLPATDVAARLDTHAEATERLLDALVVIGLVHIEAHAYRLTELGQFMRSDVAGSRRAWARLMGGEPVWRAWGSLTQCVRTGQPAYASGDQRRSETETFDALTGDPEAADVFHRAMADGTSGVGGSIVAAIDFSGVRRVVDVGGGYGALLCAALEAHPQVEGVVYDLPHAREGAEAQFERRGLEGRASFVAGDLFEQPPPRGDLLLLKSVIHDWGDDRSRLILRRCAEAMAANDRLVIVEAPAPDPHSDVAGSMAWIVAFSDLNMLVNTGGRERTAAAYRTLIESAGLELVELRPTQAFYSNFVCRRRL